MPSAGPERPKAEDPTLAAAAVAWSGGDYPAAIAMWLRLAEAGNADALYNLGQAARLGRGMAADPDTALAYYRRAAALGHPRAILRLSSRAALSTPPDTAGASGGLVQPMTATEHEAAMAQPQGLWTLYLGRYESPTAAFKAYQQLAKRESIVGFPLHLYPVGAQFELTVDQLTPVFASLACQRLRMQRVACRAAAGSLLLPGRLCQAAWTN